MCGFQQFVSVCVCFEFLVLCFWVVFCFLGGLWALVGCLQVYGGPGGPGGCVFGFWLCLEVLCADFVGCVVWPGCVLCS